MADTNELSQQQELQQQKDEPLSGSWSLWFHRSDDPSWEFSSYQLIYDNINTIENLSRVINSIPTISAAMFFFMRKGVLPIWEHESNINGGYWSFRITKRDADKTWKQLIAAMVGNTLTADIAHMAMINGISISPKTNNCIFKIWCNNASFNDPNYFCNSIPFIKPDESIYTSHRDKSAK